MIVIQKHPVMRISILFGILGLIGLALLGVVLVSVAQAPISPAAGTVNHFYNDVDSSGGYNILDNQSVSAQLIYLPDDIEGLGKLPVSQDGIERHIDFGVIKMRMPDQAGNVGNAHPSVGPGGKFWRADIHGIRAVIDSGNPDISAACR